MFGIPTNQSAGDEWEAFADWEAFMETSGGNSDSQPIIQSKVKSFLEGKGLSSSSKGNFFILGPNPGSQICSQRTCGLAEPLSLIFTAVHPQTQLCFSKGESSWRGQGPLCQCSRGDAKGCDSLGRSRIKLGNAPFPGDWHTELFFPQCSMEGSRQKGMISGGKKKNQQQFFPGRDFLHSA